MERSVAGKKKEMEEEKRTRLSGDLNEKKKKKK
jgi:hypothetical protein